MNDQPLGFFITWTVYGTWMQGDDRGWRRYRGGIEKPQPLLADWHRERLLYPVILLTAEHRKVVEQEIRQHCGIRSWHAWAVNPRTNHVHVVITANEHKGSQVRDQLKANSTRALRQIDKRFVDRPVWSRGGDWKCINDEDDLNCVVMYASEVQDAKHPDE
jgi:REP element-mobilizing transposase RayT